MSLTWKNRLNWRGLRSYHTSLRIWMSHFVSPAATLCRYDIITMFCLIKLPQTLPVSFFSLFFPPRLWIRNRQPGQMFLYIPFFWRATSIPSDSYSGKGKGSSCSGSLFSMFDASHSLWIGRFPTKRFWAPQNLQLDGALFPWCLCVTAQAPATNQWKRKSRRQCPY